MSYGIYIGKNHSATGHAWLGGYGDEPSSHWLEIVPETAHRAGAMPTASRPRWTPASSRSCSPAARCATAKSSPPATSAASRW